MPVVKCVTNDIRVPADAEWVLEGYLDEHGHVEPEGPYGEFLGYYGGVKTQSGVPCHRDHAPARRAVPDRSPSAAHHEPHRHRAALRAAHRGDGLARARNARCASRSRSMRTPSTGGVYNVRIAIRQRVPGEARNAIAAALRLARQRQERVRGRSRHRHLLRRADGMGAGDALPARPRSRGDASGLRTRAARSVARSRQPSAPRPAST